MSGFTQLAGQSAGAPVHWSLRTTPPHENDATLSLSSVAPTATDSNTLPGLAVPSVPQLLPMAKDGNEPSARIARVGWIISSWKPLPPNDMLTTSAGCPAGLPSASTGATRSEERRVGK